MEFRTERLILPVEFQGLQDLEAIINVAGFGVSKITIPDNFYKERHSNFIMRAFADLDTVKSVKVQAEKDKLEQQMAEVKACSGYSPLKF